MPPHCLPSAKMSNDLSSLSAERLSSKCIIFDTPKEKEIKELHTSVGLCRKTPNFPSEFDFLIKVKIQSDDGSKKSNSLRIVGSLFVSIFSISKNYQSSIFRHSGLLGFHR